MCIRDSKNMERCEGWLTNRVISLVKYCHKEANRKPTLLLIRSKVHRAEEFHFDVSSLTACKLVSWGKLLSPDIKPTSDDRIESKRHLFTTKLPINLYPIKIINDTCIRIPIPLYCIYVEIVRVVGLLQPLFILQTARLWPINCYRYLEFSLGARVTDRI